MKFGLTLGGVLPIPLRCTFGVAYRDDFEEQLLLDVINTIRSNFATQAIILSGSIVFPLERAKVGEVVRTAFRNGSDMINLPSILAASVTIEGPTYPGSALVLAPNSRVVAVDNLRFVPDC